MTGTARNIVEELFLAFTRTCDLDQAEQISRENAVTGAEEIGKIYAGFRSQSDLRMEEYFPTLLKAKEPTTSLERVQFYWFLFRNQSRLLTREARERLPDVERVFGMVSPETALWLGLDANAHLKHGNYEKVEVVINYALLLLASAEESVYKDWVEATLLSMVGLSYWLSGQLDHSERALTQALGLYKEQDLGVLGCRQRLGTVIWARSDYARAYDVHTNARDRSQAQQLGKVDWLAASHNCAAKCAIGLRDYESARQELQASDRLIRENLQKVRNETKGYYTLFEAQMEQALGNFPKGCELARAALNRYMMSSTPYYPGITAARATLAECALVIEDMATFHEAFDPIEQRAVDVGCPHAHSKLGFLRCLLLLQRSSPETDRDLYDECLAGIDRIHDLNERFRALSYLLRYAVKHLAHHQWTLVYDRILDLSLLIEAKIFDQLHDQYVSDELGPAVEAQLRRSLRTTTAETS